MMNFTRSWHFDDMLTTLLSWGHENLQYLPIVFFLFFLLFAIVRFYRSFYHSSFPSAFEKFVNTIFPLEVGQRVLRNTETDVEFRRNYEGQVLVFEGDKVLSCDMSFAALVRKAVESGSRPILEITQPQIFLDLALQGKRSEENFVFTSRRVGKKESFYPDIEKITFIGNDCAVNWLPIVVRNAYIKVIAIEESFRGELRFEDCWIASMKVAARESGCGVRLSIARTYIGNLDLGSNGCLELSINGGGIMELVCPPAGMVSPVEKAFSLDEFVILHRPPKLVSDQQIGNYRNLLSHIRSRSSPFTQQLLGATLFRLELKGDFGLHKVVNFCYGVFSAYNTKPGRPLLWMLSSFAISTYVVFIFDLAVYTKDCKDVLAVSSNWVSQLCDGGEIGRLSRSLSLVANAIMNPFSIFSDTASLRARTIHFNFFLLLLGLLNIVWVTLSVFSIKMRFSGKATN